MSLIERARQARDTTQGKVVGRAKRIEQSQLKLPERPLLSGPEKFFVDVGKKVIRPLAEKTEEIVQKVVSPITAAGGTGTQLAGLATEALASGLRSVTDKFGEQEQQQKFIEQLGRRRTATSRRVQKGRQKARERSARRTALQKEAVRLGLKPSEFLRQR